MPNIIRTIAAVMAGGFVWLAFNPTTPLRILIFGGLGLVVFYSGWWAAEYITAVDEHNFHVTRQYVTFAQQFEHRSDWHYTIGLPNGPEFCELHRNDCPIL